MNKDKKDALIKDIIKFIREEFFEVTKDEIKDLKKYLEERLAEID